MKKLPTTCIYGPEDCVTCKRIGRKNEKMKNNNTTGQNNFQHVSGSCL